MTALNKKHWGWIFALTYILWAAISMTLFYKCNGPQFETYHPKCAPIFLLLSPITALLSIPAGLIDPSLLDPKSLAVKSIYIRDFFFIGINLIFYYFLGRTIKARLLEEKYSDIGLKFFLSGLIIIGINWLSMIILVTFK